MEANERELEAISVDVDYSPSDTDSAQAIEILRGASRSPADPDVELSRILTESIESDEQQLRSALAKLAADARDIQR